jgi:hypothetical protein
MWTRKPLGAAATALLKLKAAYSNRTPDLHNAAMAAQNAHAAQPNELMARIATSVRLCHFSLQVLINAVWMVVSPPSAVHHYPTRDDNLLVCSSSVNASYMISFR